MADRIEGAPSTPIEQRIEKLSPAQRALFDRRLHEHPGKKKDDLPRLESRNTLPRMLSFSQERLWFLHQLDPESPAYNITSAFHLIGSLHLDALEAAFDSILSRHEVLRTRIRSEDGRPALDVASDARCNISVTSLEGMAATIKDEHVVRTLQEAARRPFDLAKDSLLRANLFRLTQDDHILLLSVHHIASDAWSMRTLSREIAESYAAAVAGRPPQLPPLPVQYADYAWWQRQTFRGEALEQHLHYWKEQLSGSPPVLDLPTDHVRPLRKRYSGARESFVLNATPAEEVRRLGLQHDATLFMTMLAAFQILLCRYTAQNDLIVGTPAANRSRQEIENLVGFFVNTLVLRTDLSGDPPFVEVLRRVRRVALEAYSHQDLPFEKLVAELQPERSLSHSPLFQVLMVFHSHPAKPLSLPDLAVQQLQLHDGTAKFDLTLVVRDTGHSISGSIEYDSDLFEPPTIRRMASHYQVLLESAVANPNARMSELDLLAPDERHRLLVEWNDTETKLPRVCIHELFEAQVERTPEAIAIRWSGDAISYRELNDRADLLACKLQAHDVGPDVPVAVCLERSPAMVVGILAALKAGGAWLPLDPDYPIRQLSFMLVDSGAPVLISQDNLRSRFPEYKGYLLSADSLGRSEDTGSPATFHRSSSPENLAYVIYTSGSTGTPKGVEVPHQAPVNHLQWMQTEFPLTEEDRVVQRTSYSFDLSIWELFAPLLTGASLVMLSADESRDPQLLSLAIQKYGATILQVVPSLLVGLVHTREFAECHCLRRVFCGGEALRADVAREFMAQLKAPLVNLYGPTESCINSTFKICGTDEPHATIPIGRPIANTRAYVLDAKLRPVPVGIAGELYIAGAGLARGYRNLPELTGERFLPDPFWSEPGARMYRTGDQARLRPEGDIEFLGRLDTQVKVRGFRIELDQVEAALRQHAAIRQAVVVVQNDTSGANTLAAYCVLNTGMDASMGELQVFVRERLPEYMIPQQYKIVESLPLTPNGKVDRKALSPAELAATDRFPIGPRDRTEADLVRIWEQVLEARPIGVTASFFDLGGHSLLAMRLFAEIEKSFSLAFPLSTLFEAPTIELFAQILRDKTSKPQWSSLTPIQSAGSKPPLFCVHAAHGNVLFYAQLARCLGHDQPLYGLQAMGLDGRSRALSTVEEMAAAYISEARTVQPEGPYYLGGYCSGAYIALEMANQLHSQGCEVALLAAFNTDGNWKRVQNLTAGFKYHLRNLRNLDAGRRSKYLFSRLRYRRRRIRSAVGRTICRLYLSAGVTLPAQLRNFYVEENNLQAASQFRPRNYRGRVVYFQGCDDSFRDPRPFWQELVGGQLETHVVPGRGVKIFDEPNVRQLADRLKIYLP